MADEEKGATDTEQQQRDLALALQLQLSLGEGAPAEPVSAEEAYMAANYGPLETANRMMAQTLDTLILDYLPDKWKNKLADIGIGFPAGYEMPGKAGAAAKMIGTAAPFVAAPVLAGRQLAQESARTLARPGPARKLLEDIYRTSVTAPKTFYGSEILAAGAAGAAGEAARQGGAGPEMQVVSELVGGFGASAIPTMIPRTAQRLVQGVKANLAPMTTAGGSIRAARQMQERAGGQVRALESADALDDLPEGVTPAQFLGDNVLMAQEARLIADNPDLGNQIATDLMAARRAAQEELVDLRGQPRTRQEWEQSVIQRVTPPGTTIKKAQTDEMLDEAYKAFDPLYDAARGLPAPLNKLTRLDVIDSADTRKIIATNDQRKAVREYLEDLTTAWESPGFNEPRARMGTTDDLIDMRSKIRAEQRAQMRAGNLERADLLGAAENVVSQQIRNAVSPETAVRLNETDRLYRQYKVIETAIYNSGDNVLTADMISEAIRTSGLTTPSRYARGVTEEVQKLRELAIAGRDVAEYLGDPERASLVIRGLDDDGKRAVQAEFVSALMKRAKPDAAEISDGVVLISGNKLTRDITENIEVMQALGMSPEDIGRVRDIANRVTMMEKKSPAAVAKLFDDGPSTIMELIASVLGAKQGSNLASVADIGQSLVLAQFFSNRARKWLTKITSDKATQLLKDAATDPQLYQALLRKNVAPAENIKAARYIESYLFATGQLQAEEAMDLGEPTDRELQFAPFEASTRGPRRTPSAPPTRGVPGLGTEQPAPAAPAVAQGPTGQSSRELLDQLFPFG